MSALKNTMSLVPDRPPSSTIPRPWLEEHQHQRHLTEESRRLNAVMPLSESGPNPILVFFQKVLSGFCPPKQEPTNGTVLRDDFSSLHHATGSIFSGASFVPTGSTPTVIYVVPGEHQQEFYQLSNGHSYPLPPPPSTTIVTNQPHRGGGNSGSVGGRRQRTNPQEVISKLPKQSILRSSSPQLPRKSALKRASSLPAQRARTRTVSTNGNSTNGKPPLYGASAKPKMVSRAATTNTQSSAHFRYTSDFDFSKQLLSNIFESDRITDEGDDESTIATISTSQTSSSNADPAILEGASGNPNWMMEWAQQTNASSGQSVTWADQANPFPVQEQTHQTYIPQPAQQQLILSPPLRQQQLQPHPQLSPTAPRPRPYHGHQFSLAYSVSTASTSSVVTNPPLFPISPPNSPPRVARAKDYMPKSIEMERAFHQKSPILVSGWLAYTDTPSMNQPKLGYMVVLHDNSRTIYLNDGRGGEPQSPPSQQQQRDDNSEAGAASGWTKYALPAGTYVEMKLASHSKGKAILLNGPNHELVLTLLPVAVDRNDVMYNHLRYKSKKAQAPVAQHDAALHLLFALDSWIRATDQSIYFSKSATTTTSMTMMSATTPTIPAN